MVYFCEVTVCDVNDVNNSNIIQWLVIDTDINCLHTLKSACSKFLSCIVSYFITY